MNHTSTTRHSNAQVVLDLAQTDKKKKLDLKDLAQLTKRRSKGEHLSPEDRLIYGDQAGFVQFN